MLAKCLLSGDICRIILLYLYIFVDCVEDVVVKLRS